jgi:hypothetical protein
MEQDWPLARALKAGDEATGVPVLMELYDRMKASPVNARPRRDVARVGCSPFRQFRGVRSDRAAGFDRAIDYSATI